MAHELNNPLSSVRGYAEILRGASEELEQMNDSIMRLQQEGMHASAKGAETLSTYQESRVRWLHGQIQQQRVGQHGEGTVPLLAVHVVGLEQRFVGPVGGHGADEL